MKEGGKSVRLFLVDGSMSGIVTAEVVNWTGHLLVAPVSRIGEFARRSEAKKTGVYMLFGELAALGGERTVYIGESDEVGRRILQHSRDDAKDFSSFVVITSKDLNLTKAHARFIENSLTEFATASGRASVLNKKEPTQGILPESDVADMVYFVSLVRLALPVLGYDVLKAPFVNSLTDGLIEPIADASESNVIQLEFAKNLRNLTAKAEMKDEEVLVLSGSLAAKNPGHTSNQYEYLREKLLANGGLIEAENGDFLKFAQDVAFRSPSAAAATITGRSSNGRTSWWIAGTQQTLKDYQHAQAEAAI